MKSNDLIAEAKQRNAAALAAAFKSGDEAQMSEALAVFMSDVHDAVLKQAAADFQIANADAAVLAARGRAAMTSQERSYFEGLCNAMKSADPKMALTNWAVTMPQTIIDDAVESIKREHPLLDKLTFQPTGYLTKFILNDQPHQAAAWGNITATITASLDGQFREVDLTMLKLTAFMVIPNDLLELGPQYLADYVKATMFEADAYAMEVGFVSGTGHNEPVGMVCDISAPINPSTGYSKQTPVPLNDFEKTTLGALVAKLARTPGDPTHPRPITDMIMLANPFDYWEKVMPATTFATAAGTFVRDYLPIPADIIQTVGLDRNELILGLPKRYFVGIGPTGKNGTIQYDDSVKFLDDARTYRAKIHCNAFPMDEYAFILCDITNLKAELPVEAEVVNTAAKPVNTEAV